MKEKSIFMTKDRRDSSKSETQFRNLFDQSLLGEGEPPMNCLGDMSIATGGKWGGAIRKNMRLEKVVRDEKPAGPQEDDFAIPNNDEWNVYARLATNIYQKELHDAIYSASALTRMDLPDEIKDVLFRGMDDAVEKNEYTLDRKYWKEIGIKDLDQLFDDLVPMVKRINSAKYQIAKYAAHNHKGQQLKDKVRDEKNEEIYKIRFEEIAPTILKFMHDHHLVEPGLNETEALHNLMEFSEDTIEPQINALRLQPGHEAVREAAKRYLLEQPRLPDDEALLAPIKQNLADLETMLTECGSAVAGPVTKGLHGIRAAMQKWKTYHGRAVQAGEANNAARGPMLEAAMDAHKEAYEIMKPSIEAIRQFSSNILAVVEHEGFEKISIPAGLTQKAIDGLQVLQSGYSDHVKTTVLKDRYAQWASKNNTQRDEAELTPRGKAAIWLRRSMDALDVSHHTLTENNAINKDCVEVLRELAAEEANGKPSEEMLKKAYKALSMSVTMIKPSVDAMREIIDGIPDAYNDPKMKDLEDRMKFRAKNQMEYLKAQSEPVNQLFDAIRQPLNVMDCALMQTEAIKQYSEEFASIIETRQKRWDEMHAQGAATGSSIV